MKFYRSVDKNLGEVEHVLFHRQVSHRFYSNAASLFALADILRFVDDFRIYRRKHGLFNKKLYSGLKFISHFISSATDLKLLFLICGTLL